MDIKILYVKGTDKQDTERIILQATDDMDLDDHVIFDTTYIGNNNVSNKVRHTYWFNSQEISAGDKVILYTKHGKDRSIIQSDGSTNWLFYWNLDISVWNNDQDGAVIGNLTDWDSKKVK